MLVEIPDDMMASTIANIGLAELEDGYNYLTPDETAAIEHVSQQCKAKLDQRNRGSDNSVVVTVSDPITGETLESQTITDDYACICAGSCYVHYTLSMGETGSTHHLTIKGRKG